MIFRLEMMLSVEKNLFFEKNLKLTKSNTFFKQLYLNISLLIFKIGNNRVVENIFPEKNDEDLFELVAYL